jgi:hypothetical protein
MHIGTYVIHNHLCSTYSLRGQYNPHLSAGSGSGVFHQRTVSPLSRILKKKLSISMKQINYENAIYRSSTKKYVLAEVNKFDGIFCLVECGSGRSTTLHRRGRIRIRSRMDRIRQYCPVAQLQ